MSLYTLVNEKVGSLLSQGMGYVSNTIGLVRNYTTLPLFQGQGQEQQSDEPFDESGKRKHHNESVGTSRMDGSGISETSETSGTAAPRTPLWPWILSIIQVMLACIIAGFVANDMIERPWPVRLLGFLLVLGSYFINPLIFFSIVVYYIFRALYSTFKGESQKTPYWFALLPLHTAKANNSWILWPFTYLEQGVKDPMEEVLDKRIEPATIKALQEAFPAYDKWKSTLSKQVDDFKAFLGNINLTEFSPAKKESPPASPSPSASAAAPGAAAPAASGAASGAASPPSSSGSPSAASAPPASAPPSVSVPSSRSIGNSNRTTSLLNNRPSPDSGSGASARGSYVPPVVPGAAPSNGVWTNPDGSLRWSH